MRPGKRQISDAAARARVLRRWQTRAEDILWQELRNRRLGGFKFRRKAPLGRHVVDFLCPAARLVVEITGEGQHPRLLEQRDAGLRAAGYGVIRLSRERVTRQTGAVLAEVLAAAHVRG